MYSWVFLMAIEALNALMFGIIIYSLIKYFQNKKD